jgi:histidyl-tRNA synthetase
MKIEVDTVKGFRDILPPESLKKTEVKKIIEKNFKLYGFVPIETPIIEFDEIMKSDNEEENEAISDRFRLRDRAGRNLGLRYEFTFQLARIMKMNPNIKLPFRRYQIGEVFRDEPVGPGRFRQFTQCDIDILGDSSLDADMECLSAVSDILKELRIDAEIEVNNRKLLSSVIESVQITDIKNTMKELDKKDKIGEDNVKVNLKRYADSNQVLTLFKLLEKPLDFFIENAFDGAEEVEELLIKSKQQNIKIKFNPFMIRGLGYYTGNIFEVKTKEKSTIAGGGRYDKSVGSLLNKEIPAVGISFGLERVTELANIKLNSIPKVIVISIEEDKLAIKLTKTLRSSGISCIMMKNPKDALEYANSQSIPHVIFLGEDEAEKNKFKIKTLASGEEKLLGEKSLLSFLKK